MAASGASPSHHKQLDHDPPTRRMRSSSFSSPTPSRLRVRAASPSAWDLENFSKEYELRDGVPRLNKCPRYGSRVILYNLERDDERQYNGEAGVIIGKKRSYWIVKLDIMPHGASIQVSPDNVKHELGFKHAESSTPIVPRTGDVSVPGFIHPSSRRRFSKSEDDEVLLHDLSPRTKKLLAPGNRVQLKELVNKPELNWRIGTIVEVEDGIGDNHKCVVALDDGNMIKVKSKNLIPKSHMLVDKEIQSAEKLRHELNACTAHIAELEDKLKNSRVYYETYESQRASIRRTRRINNGLDPDEREPAERTNRVKSNPSSSAAHDDEDSTTGIKDPVVLRKSRSRHTVMSECKESENVFQAKK
ncbi:hypothetical protein GUITHDRAFT_104167 [Guillardia theta CCMP2712]|uniref:Uncharacterized protein n=1 Tax=Guillardia theta (strain CCMP2712) TaxID=905079 RepID=L1JP52_GUITC|nr:hypothetical protein GUITHDRAFT_104167 [Guillardia theta CCMP2712]EKX50356.1 hypothetical protein GUITHDRAFT_104167 [Guillardia theta CCMP2712]|eukprot:XP_005837336.1 hypothetical protein GUITHDRAFT_104167 [Guillardia theta CCMP2712]